MADVKWIKITTDIFDDEKILLIEALPEADTLIVIWFKLLCLAGKQNNQGVFMLNDTMPYTDKMLATIFRRSEATVKLALETFQQFGMVEIVDGVVTIPNWSKHQSLEAYDRKKEYDREFQRRKREQQKALIDKQSSDSRTTKNDKSYDARTTKNDKSYDARTTIVLPEEDKEEDKDNNPPISPQGEWDYKKHSNLENTKHILNGGLYQEAVFLKDHPNLWECIKKWMKYKDEKPRTGNHYGGDTSIITLLNKFVEHCRGSGEGAVIQVVDESISANYQGITWDKLSTSGQTKTDWSQIK